MINILIYKFLWPLWSTSLDRFLKVKKYSWFKMASWRNAETSLSQTFAVDNRNSIHKYITSLKNKGTLWRAEMKILRFMKHIWGIWKWFLYYLPSRNLKYIISTKKNRNITCTFKKSREKNPTKETTYSKKTGKKKTNNKEKGKNTQGKCNVRCN